MKRDEILRELAQFFSVKELVCPHVYERWGERSWQFLATDYLHALLILRRDVFQSPMHCNNSTSLTQRGLRCNCCELVKARETPYLSAHLLGMGGDFTVQGLSAEQAREKIVQAKDLLPCRLRLEGGVGWLHLDTMPQWGVSEKVYVFNI